MFTWIVVAATAIVAVAAMALLVVREPVSRPRTVATVSGPDEVHRRFRWRWPGYDPAEVDAHLAAVEEAWRRGGAMPHGTDPSAGHDAARAAGHDAAPAAERSGEELENGGGDGPGGLDR